MASLTRMRCDPKTGVPNDLLVKYYSSRASAGLLLTECAPISADTILPGAGGIYTQDQVAGWKKVTDAVHKNGGRIFLQIWHGGRAITSKITGKIAGAPSAIPVVNFDKDGNEVPDETPRELTKEEIKGIIEEFKQGAINAKRAGFDGIELHGANGYLVDQFLKDNTNKRNDEYGGSVANRSRFTLEVLDVLIEVFGAGRVGIKLSPVGRYNDMYDSDPIKLFNYLLPKIHEKKIAYVQLVEHSADEFKGKSKYPKGYEQITHVSKQFRQIYKGTLISNQGYQPDTALQAIQEGTTDLIAFGKWFISNPDLVERIKNNWSLTPFDFSTFYGGAEKGYTDYSVYSGDDEKASSKSHKKSGLGRLFACFSKVK